MGLGLSGAYGAARAQEALTELQDREIADAQRQAEAEQRALENSIRLRQIVEQELSGGVNREVAKGGLTLRQRDAALGEEEFGWKRADRGRQQTVLGELQLLNPSAYRGAVTGLPEEVFLNDEDRMRRAVSAGQRQGAGNLAAFESGGRNVLEQTEGPQGVRTRGELRLIGARTAGDLQVARERAAQAGQNRPATGEQQKALGFYNRMKDALDTIESVEDSVTDRDLFLINNTPSWTPELVRSVGLSDAGRQYLQALRTYTEARLRKESGAAIPVGEYESDRLAIGRAIGDDPTTRTNKRRTRQTTAEGIAFGSGPAFRDFYGRDFVPGELTQAGRRGQQKTVTLAQVAAVARKNGTTVEQETARATAEGFTIIR